MIYLQGDRQWLSCGGRKLPLRPTAAPSADVPLFAPRWRRRSVFLGRFSDGSWVFVDTERRPDPQRPADYRVYRGPSGSLLKLETKFARVDGEGSVFATPAGEVRQGPGGYWMGQTLVAQSQE